MAGLALAGPAMLQADETAPAVENTAVEIKLDQKGATLKHSLNGLTGALKKIYGRYQAIVARQAPLTVIRPDDKAKDFVWSVCKNAENTTLVFLTQNKTDKARTITFTVDAKLPLYPTYRRAYSTDKGKTWETIAFEPPHFSTTGCPEGMPAPYTIEIPPYSYQTATVRLKQ